jgi:hypothetical protein
VIVPAIPAFPSTGTWNYAEGQTGLYLGVPMCVGTQYQTSSLGSWQSAFYAGSPQNINMLTVLNNRMSITGIKFEASSAASFLQVPSFETDFNEVLRYYYTTFTYQSTGAGVSVMGVAHVAANAIISSLFPRRMCKVPTVVPYSSTTFASANVRNSTTAADVAVATLGATAKGVYAVPAVAAAVAGNVITCLIRADARLT